MALLDLTPSRLALISITLTLFWLDVLHIYSQRYLSHRKRNKEPDTNLQCPAKTPSQVFSETVIRSSFVPPQIVTTTCLGHAGLAEDSAASLDRTLHQRSRGGPVRSRNLPVVAFFDVDRPTL